MTAAYNANQRGPLHIDSVCASRIAFIESGSACVGSSGLVLRAWLVPRFSFLVRTRSQTPAMGVALVVARRLLCWRCCGAKPRGGQADTSGLTAREDVGTSQLTELAASGPYSSSQRGPATWTGLRAAVTSTQLRFGFKRV